MERFTPKLKAAYSLMYGATAAAGVVFGVATSQIEMMDAEAPATYEAAFRDIDELVNDLGDYATENKLTETIAAIGSMIAGIAAGLDYVEVIGWQHLAARLHDKIAVKVPAKFRSQHALTAARERLARRVAALNGKLQLVEDTDLSQIPVAGEGGVDWPGFVDPTDEDLEEAARNPITGTYA